MLLFAFPKNVPNHHFELHFLKNQGCFLSNDDLRNVIDLNESSESILEYFQENILKNLQENSNENTLNA